ncbi:MAG: hypothetical protein ACRDWN_02845 [Acidimicrobiales bacterium]
MTLHFSQIGFTLGRTFTIPFPSLLSCLLFSAAARRQRRPRLPADDPAAHLYR